RLEMDFAKTVLQAAQHQNATSSPDTTPSIPHSDSPLTPHHSLFRKRGIAWSLVAIAAAILITITTKRSDQNRQLAQRAEPSIAPPPANAKQKIADRSNLAADQGELKPFGEAAAPQPAAPSAARDESDAQRLADSPAPAANSIAAHKDAEKNTAKDAE